MCKIDQIHSGTACAAPSDVMERAIEQAAAHVSDVVRAIGSTAEQAGLGLSATRDAAHQR